jgi:hypothetical protein
MVALELLAAENRTPRLAGEPVHRQGVGRLLGHPAGACRNGAGVRIPPVAPWLALPAERRAAAGPAGRTLRLLDACSGRLSRARSAANLLSVRLSPDQQAQVRRVDARRIVVLLLIAALPLAICGCGGSQPRTQVLRSANPLTSDIYLRITGPGGAVSYLAQRLMTGAFSKFSFTKDRRPGLFLPPRVRDRKLCSSTHTIQWWDSPELQKWRGRKLTTSVYGKKISAIYCAIFGPSLYQTGD